MSKRKLELIDAPIAGDPGQPTTQGREVRFVYPDGHKWDSVALVVLEDGTLDYCQGYDFSYGWLVWKYAGYDTIDGKPIYKVHGQGTRRDFGVCGMTASGGGDAAWGEREGWVRGLCGR